MKLRRAAVLLALALTLGACAGVIDPDGSALDPPVDGWTPHGPG